ncbi:MAG: transcriptional regulator [Methylocella sp.]
MTEAFAETPFLEVDRILFEREFDRHCFAFTHRLSDHPLFQPDRLRRLARYLARDPNDVYFDAGDVRVGQRWDQVPGRDIPLEEVVQQLDMAQAWIVLRFAQKDPEYAQLLDACMNEIVAMSGKDLGKVMKERNAIIFLNSPNRITPYHIDRECSLLFQIQGRKTISIFDQTDREVLPETEIERFWAVDNNAAIYKPEYQSRATVFELMPGQGVHIPVGAPHWVQNGPEASVSLNINFHYRDAIAADIYRANYWLRRIGLTPTPPHHSAFRDSIKRRFFPPARKAWAAWRGAARKA